MRRVLGKQRRLNCSFSLKREREERSETPYNNTFPHVFKGIRSCDDPNTSTIPATTRTKAKRKRQAPTPHNSPNWSQRKGSDTQTDMLQRELCSAICVQRFDDSLGSAIHITYRSSLRSSSMHEPRDPPLKVVNFLFFVYFFFFCFDRSLDYSKEHSTKRLKKKVFISFVRTTRIWRQKWRLCKVGSSLQRKTKIFHKRKPGPAPFKSKF